MKVISWNVASVRARIDTLNRFLLEYEPDIVLLQEIKATDETFPFFDFKTAGYHSIICGQKSYNGVAILSKEPIKKTQTTLPNFDEPEPQQARFIEAVLSDDTHLICVYVPNGNPPANNPSDTSRLDYKLRWMEALNSYIQSLLKDNKSIILGGDFNVIVKDSDVYSPNLYRNNALMVPAVREKFNELSALPLTNVIRHFHPEEHYYSFWDFMGGAYPRNLGMLLDYFFVSYNIAKGLTDGGVYKEVRGWNKTSDHAPIWFEFD
ncbi:MAG: exodeoxyribonuclease III [Alphaproteobacteria bacterium]|nr:exodeoxyribonuclease III [Alphaproteobacteria bacterium]